MVGEGDLWLALAVEVVTWVFSVVSLVKDLRRWARWMGIIRRAPMKGGIPAHKKAML